MKTKGGGELAALVIAIIALVLMALPLFAQEETTPEPAAEPEPAADLVTVTVPGFGYQLDGDEPLQACVIKTETTTQGSWVTAQLWWRNESGDFIDLGQRSTRATGPFEGAFVDLCLGLEGG